ncbi:MAG: tRNA pseudouridine(55) synthase TruB [Dehalococcoidia bacterium]|nr:MAG: tRNA pseudouridine(55) synthase TruB [Dehalococcoidia bacterium]UCG82291.1 MAG: tRNA pseudouridine(55) synthase TruB [Dehalococcoidia bacterium]
MAIDGYLNICKLKGITSFSIVKAIRRLIGERRVGHGGTLDPEASGVLPICLGRATRLTEFLSDASKAYWAEIEFGVSTDTYDSQGTVVATNDASKLSISQVKTAIESFQGIIQQTPPMYSAVKHQGVPLYRLARAGVSVPRKPRHIEIYRIDLLQWRSPSAVLEVECSKGTYIRTLANDLGEKLGCGGHLKNLVRIRSGPFNINDGVTLEQVEEAFREGEETSIIHPLDVAVLHLPYMTVDEEEERAISNGRILNRDVQDAKGGDYYRVYTVDGRFVAIMSYDIDLKGWRPRKVFTTKNIKS